MGNQCFKVIRQGIKPKSFSQIHLSKNDILNSADEKSTEHSNRNINFDSIPEIAEVPQLINDEETYNMQHPSRGIAVIFNHKNFVPRLRLGERMGTDRDKENLTAVLEELGFNVQVHDDLTYKGVEGVPTTWWV